MKNYLIVALIIGLGFAAVFVPLLLFADPGISPFHSVAQIDLSAGQDEDYQTDRSDYSEPQGAQEPPMIQNEEDTQTVSQTDDYASKIAAADAIVAQFKNDNKEEEKQSTPAETVDNKDTNNYVVVQPVQTADTSRKLTIGQEFGNTTITGAVIDADLDFKGYNELWSTVNDGYKVIYIRIKMTNISNSSNYVSVRDFSCYVDDISTKPELVGGNDPYNANIDPGRSAILGATYVIPSNARKIELEYNPIGESADRQIIVIQGEATAETQFNPYNNTTGTSNKPASSNPSVIGIGDSFGNETITGVVTNVDLDFKGYNEWVVQIDEGKKAIYIEIKVTNISNKSNYVSVGDFRCYVDNISVTANWSGGGDDYNANIDPGRSAVLGALYVIPQNANSIELEYNPIGESAERTIIKIK